MRAFRSHRRTPVHTIAMNAGAEGAVVVGELLKSDSPQWGYNAASGEYGDMIAAGIIDPTKVYIDSTGFDASWRFAPSPPAPDQLT